MEKTTKNSVLIVDDDGSDIIALTHILAPEYTVYAATDGEDAVEAARELSPDVILLDVIMPDMDGYEVFSLLKRDKKTQDIPVIFVTGLETIRDEEKGLNLGAADYITKPFIPAIVKLRIRKLIHMLNMIETIRHLSETDLLTDIYNRRYFESRLNVVWEHAKRDKLPISILVIDIDDFKKYNDTYGHLQGDNALRTVAKTIEKSTKRAVDIVARWGGEEFVALLPNTALNGALNVAESIRKAVEDASIPCPGFGETSVTVSIGMNTRWPKYTCSLNDFFSGADSALYDAKRTGKNRICTYEDDANDGVSAE